ncbi:MAG TPA: ATP-binding protein, partial [Anaerolineae bacterium]|nr:ATP-binding protein [Anaerolineae bacterium]
SEEYQKERERIIEELKRMQEETWQKLNEYVEQYSFGIVRIPGGFMLTPVVKGKPLTDEQFEKLSDEQKEKLRQIRTMLTEQVEKTMRAMRQMERDTRKKLAELDERVARFTIQHPIEELKEKYRDIPEIPQHLDAMMEDMVAHAEAFKLPEEQPTPVPPFVLGAPTPIDNFLNRYRVNLLVDHSEAQGAPVVYESNPNFANLVGRIEHRVVMGALVTDFTMIRPGALHRANGGYLVLEAISLFQRPQAWDALKRALKEGEIRVEEYAQSLGLVSTAVLEPEPIPLQVKIVLSGPAWLFYLLAEYDEDFLELFKVQADFDDRMPRTPEAIQEYARFIATFCEREGLRHFTPEAVARVVDHSSRLVSDQRYLSACFRDISDLLTEASYWAGQNGHDLVTAADVQQAIDEKHYRGNRFEERLQEAIAREILLIDVTGARPGQINGLSVLPLGQITFGAPSRITARTYMGRGGVVDIQREVKLGGPIHSKGVMILASFLGSRYAREEPLTLRASLVFEQTYSMVEGDSASLAELCALISSIGDVPLRQNLAVTGSVNQHGDVQAIGGVNEKIEGFFDACRLHGDLTGDQGVIIPAANVQHLVLRADVVEAVAAGQFHIYPVRTVDEALALLTDLPVGEPDEQGEYPPESVNGRVMAALRAMNERWKALAKGEEEEEESKP